MYPPPPDQHGYPPPGPPQQGYAPPGYPPQAYAPPPPPLRPVRGVALFAIVALVCDSVVGLFSAGIGLWYGAFVDRMIADLDSVSDSEIDTADLVYGLSGIAEFGVYVVAVVAFLVWLSRVRANAELLSPGGHRRTRPWVIFGWVVPIINFWYPKQIVDDIWYASQPGSPSRGLINAWWAAWLVGSLVSNFAGRLLFAADDLETLAGAARFDVVSIGLLLVAAVLAIGVIRKISNAQERHLQAPAPMPDARGGYPAY
ncbi:hypothetical protein HD597_011865 [Nonomuraea thailandensis]|uniref:DUF4328 domain-containing protein n=1 Tax=Nonomuraea thailandensis TaxID=1188745 RepID=A0A9X2GVP2_9ACTN|nr:DUF4328 domain-containing protein [Nonomuraea thailandensis]MCP2364845.1 hypothetical protein [Nonomuraea thailandensis]